MFLDLVIVNSLTLKTFKFAPSLLLFMNETEKSASFVSIRVIKIN